MNKILLIIGISLIVVAIIAVVINFLVVRKWDRGQAGYVENGGTPRAAAVVTKSSSQNTNTYVYLGVFIGSAILAIGGIGLIGFWFYKFNKEKKMNALLGGEKQGVGMVTNKANPEDFSDDGNFMRTSSQSQTQRPRSSTSDQWDEFGIQPQTQRPRSSTSEQIEPRGPPPPPPQSSTIDQPRKSLTAAQRWDQQQLDQERTTTRLDNERLNREQTQQQWNQEHGLTEQPQERLQWYKEKNDLLTEQSQTRPRSVVQPLQQRQLAQPPQEQQFLQEPLQEQQFIPRRQTVAY